MGTDHGQIFEGPVHKVSVDTFWMDTHEVTVSEFENFIRATGYETEAEKYGWSAVFEVETGEWQRVDGATWRHPEGSDTSASPREPVTQVSWNDAVAYAEWANKRLPTEAEWEFAARGGLEGKEYAWGDELLPKGRYLANWWQGRFPAHDAGGDGFRGRAPVKSFPPNGYGLYDMTGNVWEWVADWYDGTTYPQASTSNPRGPHSGTERAIRGGSWMCADNYCRGYRVAARSHSTPDSAMNNLGFRCVQDE